MNRWNVLSLLIVGVFLMFGGTNGVLAVGCLPEEVIGSKKCMFESLYVCNDSRTYTLFEECKNGKVCNEVAQKCTVCAIPDAECTTNITTINRCNLNGDWQNFSCGPGQECRDRECKTPLPTPTPVPVPETKADDLFCGRSSEGDNPKVYTALGCVPVKMGDFVTWLLPYLFGIAGGIAFLLMVYGFILIATSQGDPKVVQGAKETITSAITGLLISIFALFLLRLIAVDILHIPGIN